MGRPEEKSSCSDNIPVAIELCGKVAVVASRDEQATHVECNLTNLQNQLKISVFAP